MKSLLVALSLVVASAGFVLAPSDAEAKRLGGGKPAGMQRQAPPAQPANATPHTPAAQPGQNAAAPAAAPQPAAPPATPGKRSWMGPLAGLAAGLGIAALASHFGFGEGLANMMTILLFGLLAVVAVRFLMARLAANKAGGPALAGAGAGAGAGNGPVWQPQPAPQPVPAPATLERSAASPQLSGPAAATGTALAAAAPVVNTALPGGMAQEDFIRLAKMVFIRMQAANDAGNVDDLRKFTTPELFASLRLDLQERGDLKQQTDVVKLDAAVAEVVRENGQDIVSVRFHGLVREVADGGAEPFNELWHLVRPVDAQGNPTGDWAIAGITPVN